MSILLLTHPACLGHEPGPHHPERPDRLRAVLAALDDAAFAGLQRAEAPTATAAQLVRVHPASYVQAMLAATPEPGEYAMIDGDTVLSSGSIDAALRAAGAVVAGVDAVLTGSADSAFAAVRPPGHHATPDVPGGFCIFNNVAIGARHAQARHGIGKVAILDFDVHHGQGTQAVVEVDPSLFYGSTHQYPLYPGTGHSNEHGIERNVANVPLRPNSGSAQFRHAWGEIILPQLDRFAPELVIISAGFDGHKADPLAQLNLETADFAWITGELLAIADRHANGRVISALEGGYDLDVLAEATAAHVGALMRLVQHE
jgi:acetoin utilization deacetylase AcuC-like enzyme